NHFFLKLLPKLSVGEFIPYLQQYEDKAGRPIQSSGEKLNLAQEVSPLRLSGTFAVSHRVTFFQRADFP
ncbi:MAG: hypothetical protein IJ702_01900, partial [Fretibacterium sp.]|nr:hypothetical protein [Fretibacterium sp.]